MLVSQSWSVRLRLSVFWWMAVWLAPPTLSPSARPGRWSSIVTRQRSEVTVALTHTVCVPLFDISNCNCDVIGERERANLVVQLAPFFCIYISIRPARPHTVMFYVVLNMRHMIKIFCITHCTGSSHCSRAIAVPPSLPTRS